MQKLKKLPAVSLVDTMGGGEDPSLVDEDAPAPVADVAQGRQRNVHRDLKNGALTRSLANFALFPASPTFLPPSIPPFAKS